MLLPLQEAQQDTVAAFESYMEDCMVRDWAANKRQLFGLIAPHSGAALGGGDGGMQFGMAPQMRASGTGETGAKRAAEAERGSYQCLP